MTNWYVASSGSDGNVGNVPSSPFLTFVTGLTGSGYTSGDTVYFANTDTFVEKFDLIAGVIYDGESWDGTANVPTYIAVSETAASGNRATVNSADLAVNAYNVRVNAKANVTFKGFITTGTYWGLSRRGACSNFVCCRVRSHSNTNNGFAAEDNTDTNANFYACVADSNGNDGFSNKLTAFDYYWSCTSTGHTGVSPAGDGFTTHDSSGMQLTRCLSDGNNDGADFTGTGNVVLVNSVFSNNGNRGVYLDAAAGTTVMTATGCTFSGNVAEGLNIVSSTKTVTLTACTFNDNLTTGITVAANGTTTIDSCKILDNIGDGLYATDSVLSSTTIVVVKNSLFTSVAGDAPAQGALVHAQHSTAPLGVLVRVELYNNVFNNRNTSATNIWISVWIQNTTLCRGILFSNVFFAHTSTARAYHIWANSSVSTQLSQGCNYNIFQTVGSNLSRWREGGAAATDFAGWQALVGTPDANSLNAVPGVVGGANVESPSYYRPSAASSNLITIGGTNLYATGVTVDYDGRARSAAGAWNAGLLLLRRGAGLGSFIALLDG